MRRSALAEAVLLLTESNRLKFLGRFTSPMDPARRARPARVLLAIALGTLLALGIAEGGFRVVRMIRGTPYDGAKTARRLDEYVEQLQGLSFVPKDRTAKREKSAMSLQPYEGYHLAGFWKLADNNEKYWSSPEAAVNYDVMLLGGSVAAAFGNWCGPVFFPLLAADPRLAGRRIVLHWRACPGHKQPQHATNLQWALTLGDQPDLVLLLDGFNELAIAAQNAENNVNPLFPSWWEMQAALESPLDAPQELELVGRIVALRQSAEQLVQRTRRWSMLRSALLGSVAENELEQLSGRSAGLLAQLEQLRAAKKTQRPLFISGPPFVNEPAEVQRNSVRAWMEGSRSMQAMCRARNIQFVHVLQPAARDKGSKPLTEREEKASLEPAVWRQSIEQGYPVLREAGATLAREGINFFDGSRVFEGHSEEIYRDPCHFDEVGCTILAKFISQKVFETWPKQN